MGIATNFLVAGFYGAMTAIGGVIVYDMVHPRGEPARAVARLRERNAKLQNELDAAA
jgi:hypothetical protein